MEKYEPIKDYEFQTYDGASMKRIDGSKFKFALDGSLVETMPSSCLAGKQRTIQMLKRVVRDNTPQYISRNNPRGNKDLFRAHLLLARTCGKGESPKLAREHLSSASHELYKIEREEMYKRDHTYYSSQNFESIREKEKSRGREIRKLGNGLFDTMLKLGYDVSDALEMSLLRI